MEDRIHHARILLVDDEPANLRLIERILQRSGYTDYRSTSDSTQAPQIFEEYRPDLLVLDLQMPGLDGFGILERLRPALAAEGYLPVLIITGNITPEAKQRALSEGAKDFVPKPFDTIELELRIRNLLRTRLLHQELQAQNEGLEAKVHERTHALEEALKRAEDANRAKANFLAVISHELRTPLTGVIGHAELLEHGVAGALSGGQRDHVRKILLGAWHLANLVEEILDFTRLSTGRERPRLERTDLVAVAREAVDMTEAGAREKALELRLVTPEEEEIVRTDATRVRRMLLHLLSNAVKFTDRGEVTLFVEGEADRVRLRVLDTGIGIAPEHLERIWEPFWQVEDPLTRRAEGTGMGLGLVEGIARLLGATVRAESTLGEGSEFTIELPRDPVVST